MLITDEESVHALDGEVVHGCRTVFRREAVDRAVAAILPPHRLAESELKRCRQARVANDLNIVSGVCKCL